MRSASASPRSLRPSVALLCVVVLALHAAARAEPPVAFDDFSNWFRKQIDAGKPDDALRAFQRAAGVADPRTIDLILSGTDKVGASRDAMQKEQNDAEAKLESVLSDIEKANKETPKSPAEIDAYNKKVKKLEQKREEQYAKLRDLGVDAAQARAVLGSGVAALASVIDALTPALGAAAVTRVTETWAGGKSTAEDRIRYVDVLAAVKSQPTADRLKKIAMDEGADTRVRVAAISARVSRNDEGAVDDCIALLAAKDWPLQAAAIDGLRRLHKREGIEPLIAYLGREDISRLREDAHRTLKSLTGEKHGPFQQPWKDWWEANKTKFVIPTRPAEIGELVRPEKGVTFYGITTFSDKILFVLDISGSMNEPAHPDASGARALEKRIDVARREIASSLAMLDDGKKFNMLFFGHRVVRYQAGMVVADKAATERARRFAVELEPSGGTNIHDALETGFKLANTAADGKNYLAAIDTIFFLTDGTPTAGKLRTPAEILAAVKEWNRTARLTIHCIGIGDGIDDAFLQTLATENGGIYVKR